MKAKRCCLWSLVLSVVLILSTAAAGYTISQGSSNGGSQAPRVGQSFTTIGAGGITAISVNVAVVINASTSLQIYEGVYGEELRSQSIVLNGSNDTITLNSPLYVRANSVYTFRIFSENSYRRASADPYAGGTMYVRESPIPGYDLEFSVTIDESYRPDIVVSGDGLAISGANDAVGRVSGTISLRNDGTVNYYGDIPMRFTLYDGTGCTGDVLKQWTETPRERIDVGETETVTITPQEVAGDLCTASDGCQVSIYVEADYTDMIGETDETNNTYCADNKNVEIPDLTVTDIDFSAVGCSTDGLSGTVGVTIQNDGCGTATSIPVALTCDGGPTFVNQTVASLAGNGASTTVAFAISGNWSDCTDCSHQFTATVDPGNTIYECDGTDNDRTETYTSTLPDIEVSADALAVAPSDDGEATVSGTITLTNNGCGSNLTTNVPVQFTLYDNTGCTGDPVDQWTETLAGVNIAAGGGTQVFTITNHVITTNLCDNSTNCQVSIHIEADYGDVICECDGTDNTRCTSKNVDIPDLTVTDIDFSGVGCSTDGLSGTVDVTIRNDGCGTATSIPVALTSDGGPTFVNQTVASLAGSGMLATVSFAISGNWSNCTDCSHQFTATVDPGNTIYECDGTDNDLTETYTSTLPDIEVTADTLGVSCSADGTVTVSGTITLMNAGCGSNLTADVPLQFTLYGNTDCSGGVFVDQWEETLSSVNIAAGGGTQEFTISNRVITTNLCDNSPDCQVSIHIEADYGDVICECDGTDNTRCTSRNIDIPDLTVTDISFSNVGCSTDGLSGTVNVTIRNDGCGTATSIPVALTSDGGPTFVNQTVASLAGSGASTTVAFAISGNWSDCTDCSHQFTATVDPDNTICECDGTDNDLTETYTSTLPDIEVTADTLGVTCSADGKVTVSGTITLTNAGCGSNLTTNVPVQFTLYGSTGCTGSVVHQWTETLTSVDIAAGGGTQEFTISNRVITTNLCTSSTNCQVSIHIEADYGDVICECDGTDNTRCTSKNVDIPDIEVSADSLAVAASDDGEVTLLGTITLTNAGCGSNLTADVPVRFTLFDNTGCAGSVIDQWTETMTGVNIAAGGGTQAFMIADHVISTNLCDNSTGCQVSIHIEADYGDTIDECDGTDNTYCADNKAVDIPDLAASGDALSVICTQTGATVAGTVTLTNNGCDSNLTTNVPVQFTLYDNTDCAGGVLDQWTETLIGVNIPAGGGTQVLAITPRNISCGLCGCQNVSLYIEVDPTDAIWECDGTDNDRCSNKTVSDSVKPVIRDLRVDQYIFVDECCEAVVTFDGYVEDNCCIDREDIVFIVTNPTNNATVEFARANVTFTDIGKYRVNFVGEIYVSCLTGCPAFVVVTVNATDSCGNSADTAASVPDPADLNYNGGDLYDKTAPEPEDDPNGDEDRSASDNLEVRSDGNGQHRLMVREDTPVRIDVVYNDSDNCSSCTCCGTMWILGIVDLPKNGTATIEVDHGDCNGGSSIRYAPYHGYYGKDEFTYRIVDACGNVSQEATVYLEVIPQTVMDDIYLTTCVGTAVSFDVTATDLWIDPDNPGEIPFVFSIFTPPLHGVISGDLGNVTYAADGGIESATITLIYTPAAGFTGRDVLTLRFADPFGGSSTAVVDIAVIECEGQPGGPPLFVVQQGEIFPLIVPLTFAVVYEKEWHTVTVQAIDATGTLYNEALSATWEESVGRYVLRLDTASLPPGLYQMTIPLGNGETVTLMIEVGEAV